METQTILPSECVRGMPYDEFVQLRPVRLKFERASAGDRQAWVELVMLTMAWQDGKTANQWQGLLKSQFVARKYTHMTAERWRECPATRPVKVRDREFKVGHD